MNIGSQQIFAANQYHILLERKKDCAKKLGQVMAVPMAFASTKAKLMAFQLAQKDAELWLEKKMASRMALRWDFPWALLWVLSGSSLAR